MEYHNPQYGLTYTLDDAFADQFTSRGFHVAHTGGGCMAWERVSGERYIWITFSDAYLGEPSNSDDPLWGVGVYGGEAEDPNAEGIDGAFEMTLADALHSADYWSAKYLSASPDYAANPTDYRDDPDTV